MNNTKVLEFIQHKLQQELEVALLYVVQSNGSSPGRQGFHMAVCVDEELCGSIGGGIMEHKLVEVTKKRLQSKQISIQLFEQFHDKNAAQNQSGMICSGDQTIALYPIRFEDFGTVENIINSILTNDSNILCLTKDGIGISTYSSSERDDLGFSFHPEESFSYKEKLMLQNVVHIIGGGHCSLALSELLSNMDFEINVYDDRSNLNTLTANEFAHQVHILNDYSELQSKINEGENVYVVIMTVGYRTDNIALKALMGKYFKYIGMLGSATKIDKLLQEYPSNPEVQGWLKKLHAPIGLPIKSKTPQEIAVSIAAEIILCKNQ